MYNPKDPCNGSRDTRNKRLCQAKRVKKIVAEQFPDSSLDSEESEQEQEREQQQRPFAILGDFNDYLEPNSQGETSIGDLVKSERVENVVARLPKHEQWTHYYEGNKKCGFKKPTNKSIVFSFQSLLLIEMTQPKSRSYEEGYP